MLVGLLLALTACADSIGSVEPPKLIPAPVALTTSCERPVQLPESVLTQADVESFWLRDRAELVTCGERLEALRDFYISRDNLISGGVE